jgi:hypothetical protein
VTPRNVRAVCPMVGWVTVLVLDGSRRRIEDDDEDEDEN